MESLNQTETVDTEGPASLLRRKPLPAPTSAGRSTMLVRAELEVAWLALGVSQESPNV